LVAVTPALLMALSAPVWGLLLDRINPMTGRALFNGIQCAAYGMHCYGGMIGEVWPFAIGAVLHAIGNGGSTINWLTGSLYFAKEEHVSLYNSIHVGLTGLRGMTAPIVGVWIYGASVTLGPLNITGLNMGPMLFGLSALLSIVGAGFMLWMARSDQGPVEVAKEHLG